MRPSLTRAATAIFLLSLAACAHTRDVSSDPAYQPWIGKEVKLTSEVDFNVMAPTWSHYYLQHVNFSRDGDPPILGTVKSGDPVIIKSVQCTRTWYLIGGW